MSTCHFTNDILADCFCRREPRKIESLLRRMTFASDGNNIGQAHRMMAWIIETRDFRVVEVLNNGEWRWFGGNARQRKRTKVFFEMAHESITNALVEHDSTRNDHATDVAISGLAQKHAHVGDHTIRIDPHRDRININEGHLIAHHGDFFRRKPGVLGFCLLVAHLCDITTGFAVESRLWPYKPKRPGACAPGLSVSSR